MEKTLRMLAVFYCLALLAAGCGINTGKSVVIKDGGNNLDVLQPDSFYMTDQAISSKEVVDKNRDDRLENSYYFFIESQIQKRRGKLTEAIGFLKKAVEKDPKSLVLKMELAVLYLHKEETENALTIVEDILENDPESVDALIMAATIKKTLNKNEDVKVFYEKVIAIDPERENIYQILGKKYFMEKDLVNAARIFEKMIEYFPDNYVGHYYIGEIYAVSGEYDKAEAAFFKTLELSPQMIETRLELVKLYRLTKQEEKVIKVYQEILEQYPENITVAIELSLLYLKKGDVDSGGGVLQELGERSLNDTSITGTVIQYLVIQKRIDDAIVVLEGMAKGAPKSSEINYAAGISYFEKGELDSAMDHFKSVESDTRFYQNAVIHMAIIYYKNKDTDKGIEVLQTALSKVPEKAKLEIIPYLGSFYKEKGLLDKATAVINEGLAIDPNDLELLFELGVMYDLQGKTDEAINQMKTVIDLDSNHADALNYLGYTYADKDINLDEAEKLINRALVLKPNNGYIIDSLGWVYFRKGLLEKAASSLEKAVALIPNDPVVLEHLGDIYTKMNEPDKALEYYERALLKKEKDTVAIEEKIESLKKESP